MVESRVDSGIDAGVDAGRAAESDPCELRYEREFAAPREKVFRAWTDPTILSRWWGPKDFTIASAEVEPRKGGRWMTVMRSPAGSEHHVSGTYLEFEPPARLVFTWAWQTDGARGHQTIVTVAFEDRGATTLMRFHQARFETAEAAGMHDEGWTSTFESFDDFIAGGGLD